MNLSRTKRLRYGHRGSAFRDSVVRCRDLGFTDVGEEDVWSVEMAE